MFYAIRDSVSDDFMYLAASENLADQCSISEEDLKAVLHCLIDKGMDIDSGDEVQKT